MKKDRKDDSGLFERIGTFGRKKKAREGENKKQFELGLQNSAAQQGNSSDLPSTLDGPRVELH